MPPLEAMASVKDHNVETLGKKKNLAPAVRVLNNK